MLISFYYDVIQIIYLCVPLVRKYIEEHSIEYLIFFPLYWQREKTEPDLQGMECALVKCISPRYLVLEIQLVILQFFFIAANGEFDEL